MEEAAENANHAMVFVKAHSGGIEGIGALETIEEIETIGAIEAIGGIGAIGTYWGNGEDGNNGGYDGLAAMVGDQTA